jgi:hypothetical protein
METALWLDGIVPSSACVERQFSGAARICTRFRGALESDSERKLVIASEDFSLVESGYLSECGL